MKLFFKIKWRELLKVRCFALKTNATLELLGLSVNRFGDKGMEKMSDALKVNNCLRTLFIHNEGITNKSARKLLNALKVNTHLSEGLDQNGIRDNLTSEIKLHLSTNVANSKANHDAQIRH